jgi:hypothetical protein
VVALGCGRALGGCSAEPPLDHPKDAAAAPEAAASAGHEDAGWGSTPPPDGTPPTYAPTFYAVYWEILQPTCGTVFCHGTGGYYELSTPERGYETIVGVPASSFECRGTRLDRVNPGHPEASLLYLKITEPPCGSGMPPAFGGQALLEPRRIEQIRRWILRGAPRDGSLHDPRTYDASIASGGPDGAAADGATADASALDANARDATPHD